MTGVRGDLRALTKQLVLDQSNSCTHDTLPATCRRLGLPAPPAKTRDDGEDATLTKAGPSAACVRPVRPPALHRRAVPLRRSWPARAATAQYRIKNRGMDDSNGELRSSMG
jgi:hypothetical protein